MKKSRIGISESNRGFMVSCRGIGVIGTVVPIVTSEKTENGSVRSKQVYKFTPLPSKKTMCDGMGLMESSFKNMELLKQTLRQKVRLRG